MSQELAEQTGSVPDLAYSGATAITSEDVALSRVKKGEFMSDHVQEGRVEYGAIFLEAGPDDPDPLTIAKAGVSNEGKTSEPVRFYVLAGPVKGWSRSVQGALEIKSFHEFANRGEAKAAGFWPTYKYVVALPGVDEDLPATILFKGTSLNAAMQLNKMLAKAATRGPTDEVPFDLVASKRQNDKGKYAVYGVTQADVPEKDKATDLELVTKLRNLVGDAEPSPAASEPSDKPAI